MREAGIRQGLPWLFVASFLLVWSWLWTWNSAAQGAVRWLEALFLILLAGVTLQSLARQLPWQNVLSAAGVILLLAGLGHAVARLASTLCGVTSPGAGDEARWTEPLAWLVAVLTARGVGRLLLRRWRRTATYGYRLLGVSAVLVVLLDAGLRVVATNSGYEWRWGLGSAWRVPGWVHAGGVALFAALLLVAAFPWLIDKKPADPAPGRQPLVIWLLLALLVLTSAGAHHQWLAVALALLGGVLPVLAASALSLLPVDPDCKKGG